MNPAPDSASSPVEPGRDERAPEEGIALCLSGGGYRAMLFHLGALWRLNEWGWLPKLDRVSSVSGGSITAAVLGVRWSALDFEGSGVAAKFGPEVVDPVRSLAGRTIDRAAVLGGVFGPGSVSDRIAGSYDRHLFDGRTLQDLPDRPRFVINATNVQSGVLWRFSKPYMRDYRVGEVREPEVRLAVAVAASSAFPPVLSPLRLELEEEDLTPDSGDDLQREPYTHHVFLTDGGVYDNLGLETAWKRYRTVLVSDGGGQMAPEEKPKRDWVRHAYRTLEVIDNQVRSLRKRQVVRSYVRGERNGAYWGIRSDITHYGAGGSLPCPVERTIALAEIATRLKRVPETRQERLINWGYAICDTAMRRHVDGNLSAPEGFPYPEAAV